MDKLNNVSAAGNSVLSRFVECVKQHPDSTAIVVDDRSYTYAELAGLSAAMCGLLVSHGIERGDRVGIFMEDNVYTYASLLGILACGACYVPLNAHNPLERNRGIVDDAGIKAVLYTEEEDKARELAGSASARCQAFHNQVVSISDPLLPVDHVPGDLCYLLFTSGTTGKPKGVPIYHRNLSAFLYMMLESGRYAFDRNDRFLQMFELTFDLSVFSYLIPLSVGASLYPIPRKRIAYLEVADILDAKEITVALMVPSVINYLKPYFGEIRLPKMKYSLFCGEALYHDTLASWALCVPHAKIENLYGPTEATIFCMRYEWDSGEPPHPQGKGIVPIGKAMEGMVVFNANEHNSSEEGELCLSGEQVTSGYWNNPGKTAEAFGKTDSGNTFYRTGDLCKVDQTGNFLYLGRIDNQVKIDGHRVELEEIEFHTRAFCGDQQVIAVVHTSGAGAYYILLFIESKKEIRKGLEEYLRKQLPVYMIPKAIVTVDVFPLNSNGKTDRKAVLRNYLQQVERDSLLAKNLSRGK